MTLTDRPSEPFKDTENWIDVSVNGKQYDLNLWVCETTGRTLFAFHPVSKLPDGKLTTDTRITLANGVL